MLKNIKLILTMCSGFIFKEEMVKTGKKSPRKKAIMKVKMEYSNIDKRVIKPGILTLILFSTIIRIESTRKEDII